MNILPRLKEDLKGALKSKNQEVLSVLRYLAAQIHNAEIDKKGVELSDQEVLQVLQKEAKKRRESIELFKQGGRDDLVRQEESELAIIKTYLPEEIKREEIEKVVGEIAAEGGDFNAIMKTAMQRFAGRADGRLVSEVVKEKIGDKK